MKWMDKTGEKWWERSSNGELLLVYFVSHQKRWDLVRKTTPFFSSLFSQSKGWWRFWALSVFTSRRKWTEGSLAIMLCSLFVGTNTCGVLLNVDRNWSNSGMDDDDYCKVKLSCDIDHYLARDYTDKMESLMTSWKVKNGCVRYSLPDLLDSLCCFSAMKCSTACIAGREVSYV